MSKQFNSWCNVETPPEARCEQSGRIEVRFLVDTDAAAFRNLRRNALREFPDAFSLTDEEDRDSSWPDFFHRFQAEWISGDSRIVGAFLNGRLVGSLGLRRWGREKQLHKGYIWMFFVEADVRGKGIGRWLFGTALEYARELRGLEQIQLSVTAESRSARSLYASFGFVPFGHERHALKVQDRFIDLELMALQLS